MVGVLKQLLAARGSEEAAAVLQRLGQQAADAGLQGYESVTTDYLNSIAVSHEPVFPGDEDIERSYCRLLGSNAAVMVQRAQRPGAGSAVTPLPKPALPPCTRWE